MERQRLHSGLHFDQTARIAIANVTIGEKRPNCTAQVETKSVGDTPTMTPKDNVARLKEKIQALKVSRRRREISRWECEEQLRFFYGQLRNYTEGGG